VVFGLNRGEEKETGSKKVEKRGISFLFGSAADFHRPDYGHIRLYLYLFLDQMI
jgi:hypothetical protein